MKRQVVRIGCGSGFWGDTPEGARQLVEKGNLHYIIFDFLAEVTMSILARAKLKEPSLGYATDFVTQVIKPYAKDFASQGLKVVVNAGGTNPKACIEAIEAELKAQGLSLKVAAVLGDDLMTLQDQFFKAGVSEMFTGEKIPAKLVSANAYLGAFPIARALGLGADIVVTGRCADSALALGPLIHEFGWSENQYDLLSAGSLVGHVLECGPQATGGFSTDWRDTEGTWHDIGFPMAECEADGRFTVTKPESTGGAVNVKGVAEQVTYETGNPRAYLLPDVTCDWTQVQLRQSGKDRVEISGAMGRVCSDSYKVSATFADGYRSMSTILIRGREAVAKSRAVAKAILDRTRIIMTREGFADYTETSVECLGAEEAYGVDARTESSREIVLKIGVRHRDAKALAIFSREIFPTSTSTVQGVAGVFGGRPKVQPVVRLFSFLLSKDHAKVSVLFEGKEEPVPSASVPAYSAEKEDASETDYVSEPEVQGPMVAVPLIAIAYARSGDKGDMSNIAVFAREQKYLPLIQSQLTSSRVKAYMSHLAKGEVKRYPWPGLNAFNFLLDEALGGGGVGSLRYDPQGKSHAQILLEFPVQVPQAWATSDAMVLE